MSTIRVSYLAGLCVLLAACAEPPVTPTPTFTSAARTSAMAGGRTYVLLGSGSALPQDLAASVAAAGGTLASSMDGIGVATATSSDPAFAERAAAIGGIQGVAEDVMLDFAQPRSYGELDALETDGASDPVATAHVGSGETFRLVQWAPDAISAPAAWHAGARGAGARVAILDGGIRHNHIDLAANLDAGRSASMVPGQPYNADVGTFWHGTHVAGIVAAAANGIGTVGIAPDATIIGVKVLHNGSGAFSWVINGIYYAATPISASGAGAHVINMSLGALFPAAGRDAALLLAALSRATSYARQHGVTVIAAAGNDATDMDHTANVVSVPAQSVGVIAVAATGPEGWALGATNVDRPASYTNFGQSMITLAGPGGDFVLPGNASCTKPRLPAGSVTAACWVFDMVLSTSRGPGASTSSYSWAAGTSMASPAVAGVAALIIGQNPGISPAGVEAKLRQSADDLGKPGNDDFYGRGRVNAYRAIQ